MNRTLKRPMFRIGGPVNQGSGIMSHVEPRRIHRATGGRIMAAGGYNPLYSEGYKNINWNSPQTGVGTTLETPEMFDPYQTSATATETEKISTFEKGQAARRAAMNKALQYGKYIPGVAATASEFGAGILGPLGPVAAGIGLGYGKRRLTDYLISDIEKRKASIDGTEPANYKGTTSTQSDYTSAINAMEGPDRPAAVEKKEPEYVDTTKTDPKAEIKKDAALLKELLHGEDYQDLTRGEVALVLARALAEPGPIGNKLKVATELSIPIMKAKKGEDKEAILESYKAYREREKAEITAGKQGILEKDARAMTAAFINANPNDSRTKTPGGRAQIYEDMLSKRMGEEKPLEKSRQIGFNALQATLESKNNQIRKTEADIAAGKKLSKGDLETHEENKKYIDYVKLRYPDYYKANFAKGGRVSFADGTPDPEDQDTTTADNTTTEDTIESTTTPADAGTQQTQLKPVIKLSFEELRARLPKEITNDIVGLIASSEQALQDFAYIKTQQDVNNFNVKYGVNLVLPSNR